MCLGTYALQKETYCGEVGVVAGFLVGQGSDQDSQFTKVKAALSQVVANFPIAQEAKFHITDLSEAEKHKIRNKTFAVLKAHRIPLSFGAIYVDGFNRVYEDSKDKYLRMVKAARSNDIGLTKNYGPPLLHAELFFTFFGKAIDFLVTTKLVANTIVVITDKIDASIKKEYMRQIERLQNISLPRTKNWSEFDYSTKTNAHRNITISIQSDNPVYPIVKATKCTVAIIHNALTIAADVLSNSVRHCLEKFALASEFGALNTRTAIQNHPLCDQFVGMHDDLNWACMTI